MKRLISNTVLGDCVLQLCRADDDNVFQGADPNGGSHQHDYSALHFGALAGSDSVCRVLVEAGAKVDAVNTVKRTPAQMAAFVGKYLPPLR